MSSLPATVARALWELVVDDGQLAVGVALSLAATAALVAAARGVIASEAGWLLLALLVALLLSNLYLTGRRVRHGMERSQRRSTPSA